MGWTLTEDVDRYAARVWPLLAGRPVAHTLALSILETLRAGHRWSAEPVLLGWFSSAGAVTGAVSMTPPFGLLLAELPPGSEAELVGQVRAAGAAVPDVAGPTDQVHRFAACWTAGSALGAEISRRERLYGLDRLDGPDPMPAGAARVAQAEDLDLLLEWLTEFYRETGSRAVTPDRAMYQRRVELGLLWFWLDPEGSPVSLAGRQVGVAGASRVGPVYTPPSFRGRGYGSAATAAVTRDALERGAEHVLLFADLANPTSNAIYQRLGYRPVDDRLVLRFVG